jgi:glycosyltransferase involved in cell wall biosynthesis
LTHDVSVLVAAHDAEAFIEESVRSALDQTVAPSEIVVVDDGSTDATAAIAEALDPRVVVVRREHAGVGASRNAGLAVVSRPWIALLDADDVWLPTKLERQLAAFADDPAREAVFTWFDEFADADHPPPPGTRVPRTGQSASLSTGVLMPRPVIDRIGPFGTGESADWFGWWAHARAGCRRAHRSRGALPPSDPQRQQLVPARRRRPVVRRRRPRPPARPPRPRHD